MDYYVLRLKILYTGEIALEKALCDNFVADPVDPMVVYTYFNDEPICVSSESSTVYNYRYEDDEPIYKELTIWDESEQAVDVAHKPAIIDAAMDLILQQEQRLAKILKGLEELRNGNN